MKQIFICLILIVFLIIFLSMVNYNKNKLESFSNKKKNDYLYPIKKLGGICEKEGLFPSFMPKACYVNENLNSYANCKCEDKEGNCKICYPTIKKNSDNSNIIYNANKGF